MTKRQQEKFNAILAGFANTMGKDEEVLKEQVATLYDAESNYYEGQAVYNFFKARVEPRLEKNEFPADFDKRYREWRIRVCEECEEEFAYAFHYDGVKFCSLDCLDNALKKIGLQVTRGRELTKRWGLFFHPAIVPSSALKSLKEIYPTAFEDEPSVDGSNPQQHPDYQSA